MIRSRNVFNFGKYEGWSVDSVARRDPSYIWYCENRMGMEFSPKVKRTADEYAYSRTPRSYNGRPMFL